MLIQCKECPTIFKIKPSLLGKRKFCSSICQHKDLSKKFNKKQEVPCDNCGTKKLKKKSGIRKTNFCNHACKAEYQKKNALALGLPKKDRVEVKCEECDEKYEVVRSRLHTTRFCSIKCLGAWNGRNASLILTKKVTLNCTHCTKEFKRKPCEVKADRNYCSYECMGEHYSESGLFSGENSPTWQGGEIDYYGKNWRSQRRKARERDNFTCQDCKITENEYGMEMSVHHKIRFRKFDGDYLKANKLSNLVCVCEPCHRIRHSKEIGE